MTPEELKTYIERANIEREEISRIVQEEVDSINVLRELSGLDGKLYWKASNVDGDQKEKFYSIGSNFVNFRHLAPGIQIISKRTRNGVYTILTLSEEKIGADGIVLTVKCKKLMQKREYRHVFPHRPLKRRVFSIKIDKLEDIRDYFKIYLTVGKL